MTDIIVRSVSWIIAVTASDTLQHDQWIFKHADREIGDEEASDPRRHREVDRYHRSREEYKCSTGSRVC